MEAYHIAFYNQKQGKITKKIMQTIFFGITDAKLTTGAQAANALRYIKAFIENGEWGNIPALLKKDLVFTVQSDIGLYSQYLSLLNINNTANN